ncbi:amidohydrolase family protein [Limibacillus sp. MBR-115]|uniref:amidohydrolase family protein n=1 Tax=Limibacillus sp. MBR-115 TaxID=3156465 RepID=UPI00339A7066
MPAIKPAPLCLGPLTALEAPKIALPKGACDTHCHVIGPFDRFPMVEDRTYTPPVASPKSYLAMLDRLQMDRGVLVNVSVHGTDNRLLLETVGPRQDRLRAVVVIPADISEAELERMHEAGARGFRINLLFKGGVHMEALERLAAKVAPLGWHAQFLIDIRMLPEILPVIRRLPVEAVFDHMGHFPAALGPDQDFFQSMIALAEEERAWVKVSGAFRLTDKGLPHDEVRPLAEALLTRIPSRVVWGSDWPHVSLYDVMPDTGALLNEVLGWCPDAAIRQALFTDNPARLYGF